MTPKILYQQNAEDYLANSFRIALWNLDIPLEERKDKLIIYDNIRSATSKTGLSYSVIKSAIKNKSKLFIKKLNGNFTIRHIS
jgi:hypothetical protein